MSLIYDSPVRCTLMLSSIQCLIYTVVKKVKSFFQNIRRDEHWLVGEKRRQRIVSMTEKRYGEGKEGRQINQVALAWRLNQYNLSTLLSPQCCDSPVLEVGSVLYFSYSAPPRPLELPVDWCGKHRPRSHPRWQRWKVGRCGKRPGQLRWVEEHLCLLVDSPVGNKRGMFNSCGERR